MAPTQVLGEDGREINENLNESDAQAVAQRVHDATGETVTLVPYAYTEEDGWQPDPKNARLVPADAKGKPAEKAATGEVDVWKMSAKELDAYADEHGVGAAHGFKKTMKVDAKRNLLARELTG